MYVSKHPVKGHWFSSAFFFGGEGGGRGVLSLRAKNIPAPHSQNIVKTSFEAQNLLLSHQL